MKTWTTRPDGSLVRPLTDPEYGRWGRRCSGYVATGLLGFARCTAPAVLYYRSERRDPLELSACRLHAHPDDLAAIGD